MDSSNGKPTVTPAMPFKNVRRCKCFLVMIMVPESPILVIGRMLLLLRSR